MVSKTTQKGKGDSRDQLQKAKKKLFPFALLQCQISIQIKFHSDNRQISEIFFHMFEGTLNNCAKNNPL